jgi:hypothetical protein
MYEARLAAIQAAIRAGEFLFGLHVRRRIRSRAMSRAGITEALLSGDPQVIEDYAQAERGACCLVWCRTREGRVLHVVVTYPPAPLAVTAYWPDERPHEWSADFKRRVQR